MDSGLVVRIVVCLAVAYLLGAIPWALIVGKRFYSIDLRQKGSGNLGATNVLRVLGWKAALAVFILDVGKGAVAVAAAYWIVPVASYGPLAHEWAMIGATFAAILGHSFSPYIGFKGGKGVATGAGAVLVLTPLAWPILFVTFVLVIAIWRMVSLGSVVIAIEFPILVALLYTGDMPRLALAILAAGLVVWRHSANIRRIVRGEEPKISLNRSTSEEQKGGS
jgi:acyl phosphate:glycerol-3-phosphate acyltransferase